MVSHHLDGLSSLKGLGLLRPNTGQDSLNFRLVWPPSEDDGHRVPFQSVRFTPFEEFPSLVAVPHHCGRCLLAFAKYLCPSLASQQTQRSATLARPAHRIRRPTRKSNECSWLHRWSLATHRPSTIWTAPRFRLAIFLIALCSSPASTLGTFLRRKSHSLSAHSQQVACDSLPFIYSPAWKPVTKFPDIDDEERHICVVARKVALSHSDSDARMMVDHHNCKQLRVGLSRGLPHSPPIARRAMRW